MKKKLFLLLCALLTTVGTWAQPKASTPEVGKSYYLYNTKTGKFLVSLSGTPYVRGVGNAWTIIDGSDKGDGYIKLRLKDDDNGYLWGIYWAQVNGNGPSSYPDETYYKPIKQGDTNNYKLLMYSWRNDNGYVYVNAGGGNRVAGNSQGQDGLDEGYTVWNFVAEEDYLAYFKSVGYPFSEIPSVDYTAQGSAPAGGHTYVLYNETGKFLYNDADGKTPRISSSQASYYTLITTGSEYYIRSNTGDLYKDSNSNWNTWTNGNQGDEAKWSATEISSGKYKLQNHNKAANTYYFAPNSNGEEIQCYCDKTNLTGWYFIDVTDKDVAISLRYALQQATDTYYTPAPESGAKENLLIALNDVYLRYVIADGFTSTTYDNGVAAIQTAIGNYEDTRFDDLTGSEGGEDITSWITNPTPTANGNGWNLSQTPTYDSGNNVAEFWNKSAASLSQTIANVPAGYYRLTTVAFTRTGMSAPLAVSGATSGALNSMNITTVGSDVVNGRGGANTWFNSGHGVNELDFYVPSKQNVTISLTTDNTTGDHWMVWRSFQLTAVGKSEGNLLNLEKYLDNAALERANAAKNDASNNNVIGVERTNLVNAINALNGYSDAGTVAEDVAARKALKYALIDPYNAFTDPTVPTNYDALIVEIAKAKALGIADATADGYAATSTSTAATVLTSTQSLMVAEYNYATENYATPIDLGVWTETGTHTKPATFSNEHWSGTTREYKNQDDSNGQGYNASTWSMGLDQDITLPAGDYVFKVAGRKSADATMTLTVTNKATSAVLGTIADFPSGNSSRGINKSGATAFEGDNDEFAHGGAGYGWQWRYVPFSLDAETTVNIAVTAGSSLIHNWASFGDYAVWSKPNEAASMIAYNKAMEDAGTAKTTYPQVTGSELTELNAALDADPGSTVETIDAATTVIKTKTSALIAAAPSYDAYVLAKSYGEAINSTLLPYASTAKLSAVTTALSASVTSAATAETATAAINTANRAAYESNMNAEGVTGAKNRTSLVINADANGTDGWTGAFGRMSNEPYTEADGTATNTYFDKNGVKSFTSSQTIKLVAGTYILSVTARAQAGIDSYKLKVTNNADETEEVALTAMGNANGVFNRGWNVATVEFTQKAFGDATISIEADNTTSDANFWMSWDRFRLVSIADEGSYSATIGATGWTTFASAYPLDLSGMTASEGTVKAYYASAVGGENVTMTSTNKADVAAGEGLMLKGTAGATITIPVAASGTKIDGNKLKGCVSETVLEKDETSGYNNYVLVNNGGVAQFQSLSANGATIPAGKAYLQNGTYSAARLTIILEDEVPTEINAIEAADTKAEGLKDGKYLIGNKIILVKNGVKFNANGQILK